MPEPTSAMTAAVQESLEAADLEDCDQAAAVLAVLYARQIDKFPYSADALATFGPKLLTALRALGMVPTARHAATGPASSGEPTGPRPLDSFRDEVSEQRKRREQRAG